jgi:hypothetical protein
VAGRDQCVYVQDLSSGSQPVALTAADSKQRFANYELDGPRKRLLAVCEDHSKGDDQEATNSIAAIGKQVADPQCLYSHASCIAAMPCVAVELCSNCK